MSQCRSNFGLLHCASLSYLVIIMEAGHRVETESIFRPMQGHRRLNSYCQNISARVMIIVVYLRTMKKLIRFTTTKNDSHPANSCAPYVGRLWTWPHGQAARLERITCFAARSTRSSMLASGCGYEVGSGTPGSSWRSSVPELRGDVRTHKDRSTSHREYHESPLQASHGRAQPRVPRSG